MEVEERTEELDIYDESERPYSRLALLREILAGGLQAKLIWCLLAIAFALGIGADRLMQWSRLGTGTVYQAVTLNNGVTYYGKLSGLGSAYPILSQPFTVKPRLDVLSGTEKFELHPTAEGWHMPDSMIVPVGQIVMIEPVASSSQVGRLISKMSVRTQVTGLPKQ